MKSAALALIGLISLATTCAMYGWLESSVNLIQGLGQLFAPGATTVLFSPFLVLIILLFLGVFAAGQLIVVGVTASLCRLLLRSRNETISDAFGRVFVFSAIGCQFVAVVLSAEGNAPFLLRRPIAHSAAPAYVMASLASANAALSLILALSIIRRPSVKPNPLKTCPS